MIANQRHLLILSIGFFTSLFLSAYVTNTSASPSKLDQSQAAFLKGVEWIKSNQRLPLVAIKQQLSSHPLYPQLLYQDYIRNLNTLNESTLLQFVQSYSHLSLAERLKSKWLIHQAENNQWQHLNAYQSERIQDESLKCYVIQAQINLNTHAIDLNALHQIWLDQLKLKQPCQPIESYLIKKNQLPGHLIWQKIEQAIQANHLTIARQLSKMLSKSDQQAVQEWLNFYRNPNRLIQKLPKTHDAFIDRKIFLTTLEKLANQQPSASRQLLELHQQRYQITPLEQQAIERKASLRLAYRYDASASEYLDRYHQQTSDPDTLRWRAQIAIRESDWRTLLKTIGIMDSELRQDIKWQYWTARALEQLNQQTQANLIFSALATQRHYYGFLAADRLNLPYRLQSLSLDKIQLSPEQTLEKYPALKLIEQLLAIGWPVNAEREWQNLLNNAATEDLSAIALVANQWQHHTYAIRALAAGKEWDLLELRFPTPYNEPVMQNAEKNNLNAAWIYSIIRRESAYLNHIKSPAGAIGLMQLLPNTARYISRQTGRPASLYKNLTDAHSNIELGSAYLKYLLDKYNGHLVMATAAYNAGPKRIAQWQPNHHPMEADQWIEAIPFQETRKYVKSILEYKVVFETLLGQQPQKLSSLMQPIPNLNKTPG